MKMEISAFSTPDFNFHDRKYKGVFDPSAPVQPSQCPWELRELLKLYTDLAPAVTMEIGSFNGGMLYQLLKHAPRFSKIISVDLPLYVLAENPTYNLEAQKEKWQTWASHFDISLYTLTLNSGDPETQRLVEEIAPKLDFLFIDGGHLYEEVKQDFNLYLPMMRSGGIVAFHDLDPTEGAYVQVCPFWREIQAAGFLTQELRFMPHNNLNGTGVVFIP